MIRNAENKVIVTVKTKYIKNFTDIMKVAQLQNQNTVKAEDIVNIVGEIVSIPNTVSKDRSHEGFTTKDIQVGDIAIFSHSIIYDWYQKEHNGELLYKNLISIQGKEYWAADITKIYGVIRDEKTIMINGYVMATTFPEDLIVLAAKSKKVKGVKSSQVLYIGNPKENKIPITAKEGDTIFYNPNVAIKYQINNKPFIILQQHHVLGKVCK